MKCCAPTPTGLQSLGVFAKVVLSGVELEVAVLLRAGVIEVRIRIPWISSTEKTAEPIGDVASARF
jgi:hypothetical protein